MVRDAEVPRAKLNAEGDDVAGDSSDRDERYPFNSVQLNIVAFVDVGNANATESARGNVYMVDNSGSKAGQGTDHLQTCCKQGQVLNWIIYPIDGERRPDGTWPPSVRISNIVFLEQHSEDVSERKICGDLRILGSPDKVRSPLTPVYYYWAGTVVDQLPAGIYRYRIVLELQTDLPGKKRYLNVETPSLKVVPVLEVRGHNPNKPAVG